MARSRLPLALTAALLVGLAGCTPTIAPLYRDYRVGPTAAADTPEALRARVRTALTEAGWTPADAIVPEAISTEPRKLADGIISDTHVTLDVIPVGGGYVRVQFNAYRHYFTGSQSKIPFLTSGLRQRLVPSLNEALARQGLIALDIPRRRDEEATNGD